MLAGGVGEALREHAVVLAYVGSASRDVREAVLVDPLMTTTQAEALARWVEATGKNLTTVYATHGHGDHFFGLSVVLDRFPDARALATPGVVEVMRQQASAEAVASFWQKRFPSQIPKQLAIADALTGPVLDLEGHDLVVVELGHTDTDRTTGLHIPDIGLVVAGDAALQRRPPVPGRVLA